jgi:hypothetical protein
MADEAMTESALWGYVDACTTENANAKVWTRADGGRSGMGGAEETGRRSN